ncbi:hypothetical protein AVEN_257102-1 [Araneus ventricosus]|uniref:Uncharacterized protein n=1 Tax=Araneus ventricosus TaxID=182803 RepID=A0A4Y2FUN3_ARAVE|nr:hypothetical protein AVEN_257102-1 [Araneus ventricosus]
MDTYEQLFDRLDDIDWGKEKSLATPATFNFQEEVSRSLEMPKFDEMMDVTSPIHSPPAMQPISPILSDAMEPCQKPPAMEPYHKTTITCFFLGRRTFPERIRTNKYTCFVR